MITLKQVNKAIQAKWPGVGLAKGEEYFYLYGTTDEMGLKIAGFYQSGIYVHHINQMPLTAWLLSVEVLMMQLDKENTGNSCNQDPEV